jgi:hypothetical protein
MSIRHRMRPKDLPAPVRAALRRFLTHLESRTGTGWKVLWLTRPSPLLPVHDRGPWRQGQNSDSVRAGTVDLGRYVSALSVRRLVTLHTGIDPTAKAREAGRLAQELNDSKQEPRTSSKP